MGVLHVDPYIEAISALFHAFFLWGKGSYFFVRIREFLQCFLSVSYTHLTLPTIVRV